MDICDIFIIFVLIITLLKNYVSPKTCIEKEECSKQIEGSACSFCVGETGSANCLFPFPERYIIDPKTLRCSHNMFKYCKTTNPCKNGGVCRDDKYEESYSCMCKLNYVGRNCEIKYDKITFFYVYDIDFPISNAMQDYNPLELIITIPKGEWLEELNVVTEDGYYTSVKYEDSANFGLQFVNNTYKASIRYLYRPYNVTSKDFIYLGKNVLGYFTTFQINIIHRKTAVFNANFKVFVSYPEKNHCVPIVELHGCSDNYKKPTTYNSWSEILISSSVSTILNGNSRNPVQESCDSDGINLSWQVFFLVEYMHMPDKVVLERYKDKYIIINPLSKSMPLECGLYRVELNAKNVFSDGYSESYAICYFEIETLPLEAIIEGGTHRSVAKRDHLILSAFNSRDPNELPINEPIMTKWSCTALKPHKEDIGQMCKSVVLEHNHPYSIPPEKLEEGEYNFTLEIWANWYNERTCSQCERAKEHQFSYQVVVVANKTNLLILCQINCGKRVTVNNELILKVSYVANTDDLSYQWTFMKADSFNNESISKSNDSPSYIFQIPEDTLETATSYNVLVTVTVNGDLLSASYGFETDDFVYSGNCSTDPNSGVRGITYFYIKCTTVANKALMFEFFDKTLEEVRQKNYMKGRMLGTSNTGELQDNIFTRGVLVVYIINGFNRVSKSFEINLIDDIDQNKALFNNLQHNPLYLQNLSYHLRMQLISAIPDFITNSTTQKMFLDVLLKNLRPRQMKLVKDIKANSLILYNTLSKLGRGNMDVWALKVTRKMAVRMTNILKSSFQKSINPTNVKEAKEILGVVLNIFELSLGVQNETDVDGTSKYITTDTFLSLSHINGLLAYSLSNIQTILSILQKPGLPPTQITSDNSSFIFKVLQDDPIYNYSLSKMLQFNPDIPVTVSPVLLKRLYEEVKEEENFSLNVGIVKKNLFKWFDKRDVSNLLFVSLRKLTKEKHGNMINVEKIGSPVDMELDFNRITEIEVKEQISKTIPIYSISDENNLDLQIRVHRLDPAPRSKLSVAFLYPPTNVTLRVLILEDYRPTYKMMISDSILISQQSPYYSPDFSTTKPDTFYYMGVLPGPGIPLSYSAPFSFAVNSTSCMSWERVMWSTSGCKVGSNTSGHRIHCQCNHLSIFGAISFSPPNHVDPFSDAKLFLTVMDNPFVVSLMVVLFVFYVIILILFYRLDKKDRFCGTITVLEDNFPGDGYPYILAVYTSFRFFSGTSANIGIQLIGKQANSRSHILKSRLYKVLRRHSDDWFLILCPKPLGFLKFLHIWHDNAGLSPAWYCDKVHVYDIDNSLECLFIVDQWLELNVSKYPEALIIPASSDDILKIKTVLGSNISKCLSEKRSVTGIFIQHPRSIVRRFQRANIFMCCLLAALLCSLMFYTDRKKLKPDDFSYKLKIKELYVSFIIVGVVFAVEYVLNLLFRKSYKCVPVKNQSRLYLRQSLINRDDYFDTDRKSSKLVYVDPNESKDPVKELGLKEKIAKIVERILKSQDLAPAVLPYGDSGIEVNKFWLVFTWTTCAFIIIICTYLIMLFGLKMGLVKSKKWLTSVILSFAQDTVVTGPLSAVIFAFAITVTLGYVTGSSSYRASEYEIQKLLFGVQDHSYDALISMREQPMYFPISDKTRDKLFKKRLIFTYCTQALQMLLSLCYIITIVCTVRHLRHLHYRRNSHLKTIVSTDRWSGDSNNFYDAYDKADLSSYFQSTFLKVIYTTRWYNNMPLNHDESLLFWTSSYSWRLVGVPYIRQQRVYEEQCNSFTPPLNICIPKLSHETEETHSFGTGWSVYSPYDTWTSSSNDPWIYTYPTANWMKTFYRLCGRSGTVYNNGGYKAELGTSIQETVKVVVQLVDNTWVDKFTKVVFVELILFNVDLSCLGQITLIVEFLTSGVSLKEARIDSVILECDGLKFRHIAFIMLTFLFFLEICCEINNNGFTRFFKSIRNILLLVIVIPSIFVIIAYLTHVYLCVVLNLYDRYYDKEHHFFDFDTFFSFHTNIKFLLSFFLLFGVLRTLLLLRSLDVLLKIHKLFKLSLSTVCFLLLLTLICYLILFEMLIHLDISTSREMTVLVVSQKKPNIFGKQLFNYNSIVFSLVKCCTGMLISSCFIIMFIQFNNMYITRRKMGKNLTSKAPSAISKSFFTSTLNTNE